MIRSCRVALPLVLVTLVLSNTAAAQDDGWRTIEIETTEVTTPDVAVTPDGDRLIFTLLGHLFRLPVGGGEAEQLTFGPYYDARPAVSPDGTQIAFQSDRDGSEGNIFLLDVTTGEIIQLTDEPWADAPSWAPDGQSVVYLRLVHGHGARAMVRRVRLNGSEPETLRAEVSEVHSPFHLPDGRVGWAVVERATTRIEVMDRDGTVSTLRTLDGVADAIVASDEEFFVRRYIPVGGYYPTQLQEVVRVPRAEGQEHRIVPVSGGGGALRFAWSGDDETLYVGNLGRLWKVSPAGGRREAIPFRARVRMEVRDPVPPPKWFMPVLGASRPPTSIRFPRLSPDGQRLVFLAARDLWEQPLDGGPIRRLTATAAVHPAFSPDGSRIAFGEGRSDNPAFVNSGELQVFDVATGQTQSVSRGQEGFDFTPTWTRDGQRLIVWEASDRRRPPQSYRLVAVDLSGTRETLMEAREPGGYTAISPDGQWLYFVDRVRPDPPTVFRLSLLDRTAPPEPVTQLAMAMEWNSRYNVQNWHYTGRVSPDGQWLAYQPWRTREIRVVPLGGERVTAEDSRLLSPVGGNTGFAFTHDGSAVVYAGEGNSVWRHPLNGDEPEEIPVRLELERPAPPPPVLLRRVRMLDLGAGGFGSETSVLIEDGRIAWIGSEQGQSLPPGTTTLDAVGRFAIPGLFDMHAHNSCGRATGRAHLAHGVTSVRNMGEAVVEVSQAADREFTGYGAPRCFYAGNIFNGEQGGSLRIYTTDDARAQVRLMHEWGASFIKLGPDLPWPLHLAAADEARRLGLPVVRHGMGPEEVVKGVTLGGLLTHTSRGYDDLLLLLAAVGMRGDPTLGGVWGRNVLPLRDPERFPGPRRISQKHDDAVFGFWAKSLASVQRGYQLGITLLPGTDWGPFGWTLHLELELFAEAGIPPLDILRFATQASAETVGAGDDLGTLEVGKLADIVLLDANPLEDIKNTQTIWRVLKGGRVFDPEELRPERN